MAFRQVIRDLVLDLSDDNVGTVKQSIGDARYLLQQSARYRLLDSAAIGSNALTITAQQRKKLQAEYRELLPTRYVGLTLTEEEIDAVVDAIVRLIDGSPGLAGSAAWALSDSGRLSVLPRLAELLRRSATEDAWITKQAAFALSHVLMAAGTPTHSVQRRIMDEAIAVLRYAASVGVAQGAWDGREAAQAELEWIAHRFGLRS